MKSIITYVLVLACLSISCFAEPSELAVADSLMLNGALKEASLSYEKIIYNNSADTDLVTIVLLHKAGCLKSQGLFDRIEPLLRRVDVNRLNDSLKFQVYYEKALGCYLSESFDKAEKMLLPAFNIRTNYAQHHAATMLYCLVLNESGRWMESYTRLKYDLETDTTLAPEEKESGLLMINEIYNKDKMPVLKSIKKARLLSLLLPGLGQAYNRNYGKAALSFSSVGLSGLYIAYNIVNTTYLTAATSGVYLFLYFYFGGAGQANVLVPEKNYRKKADYNTALKQHLMDLNTKLYIQ